MGTKILKKLKKQATNKPAALAVKIRKRTWYVLGFFLTPAFAATVLILLQVWVPGLAWLE